MKNYICIDIGGTAIKYGIIRENLKSVIKKEIPTESHLGGKGIMEKIFEIIEWSQKNEEISGVAISTAGMVEVEKGEIIFSCELIPGYTGTPIKKMVEKTFAIPCEVENDVHCAGLAEALIGAGKGKESCLCLTIGTGIGGAFVLNGHIYRGFSQSACEVGYLKIGNQNFQDMASTKALVKKVADSRGISPDQINGKRIFEEAKKGAPDAIKAIDELVEILGEGISNCVYILNPEIVILGGGIMAQESYLKERIEKTLEKNLIPTVFKNTTLAFAKKGNDAGMLGALIHFLRNQ